MKKILHINASGRSKDSVSRKLSGAIVEHLNNEYGKDMSETVTRDVSANLSFINETMINAYYTPKEDRTAAQNESIALSNQIISELMSADVLVIGTPMYNFGPPASLKAWADLAARVGETFRYSENGPVGLLKDKKAFIAISTGGAPVDSPVDFLTPWLRHFLGFLGIADVQVIKAESLNKAGSSAIEEAIADIKGIAT